MDLAQTGGALLPEPVAALRSLWFRAEVDPAWQLRPEGSLPACAGDFVIPSASQVAVHASGPAFLGNDVNPDASHVSGAELADEPPHDLSLVRDMLQRIGA